MFHGSSSMEAIDFKNTEDNLAYKQYTHDANYFWNQDIRSHSENQDTDEVDETEYEFVEKDVSIVGELDYISKTKANSTDTCFMNEGTEGKQFQQTLDVNEHVEDFSDLDLITIVIPEAASYDQIRDYTIADVSDNNVKNGKHNWFIYGRKVYSLDRFLAIVRNRIEQYLELTNQDNMTARGILTDYYPVYGARNYGVRKTELNSVLSPCQIGKLIKISREEYLSRMKSCVDIVKSDLETQENLTENLSDYLEQLSRWLYNYQTIGLETLCWKNVDPNNCEFPLPEQIRADSTILRRWAKDWTPFDFSLDGDAAWNQFPFLNEDWGDAHEIFIDILSKRVDENFADMNMEIEGEAAWNVIDLDIVKNDKTTEEQEIILKAREVRTDLHDTERMRRRRKQIADGFLSRHKYTLKSEDMIPYTDWATRLERHWAEFQNLCL